jgi:uncharacterized protein YecT (DUF1311 family)
MAAKIVLILQLARLALIPIGVTLALIPQALSAPRTSCIAFLIQQPSDDFIICNDDEVKLLDKEMDALLQASLAQLDNAAEAAALQRSQQTWRNGLASKCGLPPRLTPAEALHFRGCVAESYLTRFRSLPKSVVAHRNRLRVRPAQLLSKNAYFLILSDRATLSEAKIELKRLKQDFPFEEFAIYPPHEQSQWIVVFASYVDKEQADEAKDLARTLSIAPESTIWRMPETLFNAGNWGVAAPTSPTDGSKLPGFDQAQQEATGKKIVSCFQAGVAGGKTMTIRDMHDCAEVWVSPLALVRCAGGAACSVLPDTLEGRAAFDAILLQYEPKLTRDSVLSLSYENLPRLPTAAVIEQCKVNDATDEHAYLACIGQSIDGEKYKAVVDCFAKPDEGARLACFADNVKVPISQRSSDA